MADDRNEAAGVYLFLPPPPPFFRFARPRRFGDAGNERAQHRPVRRAEPPVAARRLQAVAVPA
ncbi:MAG: hypothetical protein ACREF6_18080, partial [Alphaproteobacteria bacterium]